MTSSMAIAISSQVGQIELIIPVKVMVYGGGVKGETTTTTTTTRRTEGKSGSPEWNLISAEKNDQFLREEL